jgi:hypothetical protein
MCMIFHTKKHILADTNSLGSSTDVPTCNYVQVVFINYVQVFCKKYLHIPVPTAVCVTILLYFAKKLPARTVPVSAPVSAQVPARLHRRLRGCIAVASPSHRRRIAVASPHRIAARNAGDFSKITFACGAADL